MLCHHTTKAKQLAIQGLFKQLHAFSEEPQSETDPALDLHTPDPLNIINVALARQQAAVQAGCSGHRADTTNLVHTLFQHHQALLDHDQHQQQQQQQRQQQQSHHQQQQYQHQQQADLNEAAEDTHDHEQVLAADNRHLSAVLAVDNVVLTGSPGFQGEMVPDTPVAAAEAATQEAANEAAEGVTAGAKQQYESETAAVGSVELLFDDDSASRGQQRGSTEPAALDLRAGPSPAIRNNQQQVCSLLCADVSLR